MNKILSSFLLSCLLLMLLGCQQDLALKDEEEAKSHRMADAARYNTQLGVAYLKQGDVNRAKRKLLSALKLAPRSPEVQAAMGYFLEQTNDMSGAKQYYQKALSLAPDSGAQKNNYGAFLCRIGEYKPALQLLLDAGNDVKYANSAMAYENAGLCASAMHDDEKSLLYFERAVSQDPERQVALYELVKLFLKHREAKKALYALQEHAAVTLANAEFLSLAVEAARADGNLALAADYSQRLQALNPGGRHEHS